MREFDLIGQLAARAQPIPGVSVGIGDDAAVLEPDACDLVALDTMVEGLHFKRDFSSPQDIGWKLLACNLSDIAAMGGEPRAYFLSLSLGEGADAAWVEGLYEGMRLAAEALAPRAACVAPAGGDTTGSPGPLVLSLTLMGKAPARGAVLRSTAREGDAIVVFGELGMAMGGLEVLRRWPQGDPGRARWPALLEAHRRPRALCRLGAALGERGLVHAMLDVSDGLLQDMGHMLRASGLGARIFVEEVPVHPRAQALAQELGLEAVDWSLSGGDDYALVAAAGVDQLEELEALCAQLQVPMRRIGVMEAQAGVRVVDAQGRALRGAWRGHEHNLGVKAGEP